MQAPCCCARLVGSSSKVPSSSALWHISLLLWLGLSHLSSKPLRAAVWCPECKSGGERSSLEQGGRSLVTFLGTLITLWLGLWSQTGAETLEPGQQWCLCQQDPRRGGFALSSVPSTHSWLLLPRPWACFGAGLQKQSMDWQTCRDASVPPPLPLLKGWGAETVPLCMP